MGVVKQLRDARKARRKARSRISPEQREVNRVKRELAGIFAIASKITSQSELNIVLAQIADPLMRDSVAKLLEPMLTFNKSRVILTDTEHGKVFNT